MQVVEIYLVNTQTLQRLFGCRSYIFRFSVGSIRSNGELGGQEYFISLSSALEPVIKKEKDANEDINKVG